MKPEKYESLRLLTEKYHIHFDVSANTESWPDAHKEHFTNIQKLGKKTLNEYSEDISIDPSSKPWKQSIRGRAMRLSTLAERCRAERKNEAGWRLSLESEIMSRFTVEVACPDCRGRLWRSEIEVDIGDDTQSRHSLGKRRRARSPCQCAPLSRGEDYLDHGLNALFSDRADEFVVHDDLNEDDLPRQKPDRLYGLRSTRNIERLLNSTDTRPGSNFAGKVLRKILKISPIKPSGQSLLFPFLILEAKSEKGEDSFDAIEMQSSFSVRALLKMQVDLRLAAAHADKKHSDPLVWFIGYKGEQWRVFGGYCGSSHTLTQTRISKLWTGNIDSLDGALQLLLIMDYIFDWARDRYRPAIIRQLKCLVGDDTSTLAGDSDIASVKNPLAWLNNAEPESTLEPEFSEEINSNVYEFMNSLGDVHGVLRHACFIRSRVLGLYITEENVQLLLDSFSSPGVYSRFSREILKFLRKSWRVTAACLENLEAQWTGDDTPREDLANPVEEFWVKFTISAHFSPAWEQYREISYVAVSENALLRLAEETELLKYSTKYSTVHFTDSPLMDGDLLAAFITQVLGSSIEENLSAAVVRSCLCSTVIDCSVPSSLILQKTDTLNLIFEPDNDGSTLLAVSKIYSRLKKGMRKPDESFLRVFVRLDEQNHETGPSSLWNIENAPSCIANNGSILLKSKNSFRTDTSKFDFNPSEHQLTFPCLYLVEKPRNFRDVASALERIAETLMLDCYYQTPRRDITLRIDKRGREINVQPSEAGKPGSPEVLLFFAKELLEKFLKTDGQHSSQAVDDNFLSSQLEDKFSSQKLDLKRFRDIRGKVYRRSESKEPSPDSSGSEDPVEQKLRLNNGSLRTRRGKRRTKTIGDLEQLSDFHSQEYSRNLANHFLPQILEDAVQKRALSESGSDSFYISGHEINAWKSDGEE